MTSQADGKDIQVSIVIVCWNSGKFISECLTSIHEHSATLPHEVIVIDNASSDHTVQLIEERHPEVRLLRSDKNLGFAHACNLGACLSTGKHILFLNPDTRFQSDVAGELARFLEDHEEAGAVSPQIIEQDGTLATFAARKIPSLARVFVTQFGFSALFPHSEIFSNSGIQPYNPNPYRVPMLQGAALMIPRRLLFGLGLLDESLPMYFEDLDICMRIVLQGKKLYLVPTGKVVHFGGKSSELSPVRPLLYSMENGQALWLFFRKFKGPTAGGTFILTVFFASLFRVVIFTLLRFLARGKGTDSAVRLQRNREKSLAILKWVFTPQARYLSMVEKVFARETELGELEGRLRELRETGAMEVLLSPEVKAP